MLECFRDTGYNNKIIVHLLMILLIHEDFRSRSRHGEKNNHRHIFDIPRIIF
jgi:hypothetical protein